MTRKTRRATAALVASLALLAGCGYDTGEDLPGVVSAVTPADARPLTACGGSSGLIESPSYECAFFTPGDGAAVTSALAQALRREGFEVACRAPGEITAVRRSVRVTGEVAQHGSVVASGGVANVYDSGYVPRGAQPIPTGFVAIKIAASRLSESSASFWTSLARKPGRCDAPLPKPNLAEHCVNWWNATGRPTALRALRAHARPRVEIRTDWGVERAACTYTLHTRAGYLRVTTRFEHGRWIWPRLRRAGRVGAFRPNAWLNEDGRSTSRPWASPRPRCACRSRS